MGKKLVIVESPAKAKTIKGFLGADYEVLASIGHIRDLAENKSELEKEFQKEWWADYSVNVDKDFEPIYIVPREKAAQVKKLRDALKVADELVLATDEDREGESISWHLLEVLKPKKGVPVHRIAFHEITRDAIQAALRSPRAVDHDLVRAQETRRILDRLYGYTLSPVLWKLGRGRGLSAGRVQTPAVKLVVERELERRRFVSASYWDLAAQLQAKTGDFAATLIEVGGARIASGKDDFVDITGQLKDPKKRWLKEDDAKALASQALKARPWTVLDVQEKPEQRRPYAPFMTSTLQQEANRKLGFPAERTMRVAQDLYEGIESSGIEGGLITYMRTDSLNLSETAVKQARDLIADKYGKDYLPEKPNRYTSKVNNAQEAHEAIRPTDVARSPEEVARLLGRSDRFRDHIRLYELIWKRTVASQMRPAELMITSVKIGVDDMVFSSSGKSIKFPGFLRAYVEGSDDPEAALEDQEKLLPALKKGETVEPKKVEALGHTTKPPARYTDASLVKALEERGIGRPSTYAATLKTIVDREYVRKEGKELVPTFMAFLVTEVLDTHFSEFSDLGFTADMDRDLDKIASGNEDWKRYLKRFFLGADDQKGLKQLVDLRAPDIRRPNFPVGEDEGEPVVVQFGRNGFFLVRGELEGGQTASVPEDLAPADLTLEKAKELLIAKSAGPESAGIDPVTGRRLLVRNRGGFYLEAERTKEEVEAKVKPRWVSVPPGVNPKDLAPEELDALCHLPKNLGKSEGVTVELKMGKYGAYVEMGTERRTVEDWKAALAIDLEGALALLAQPKTGRGRAASSGPAVLKEIGEIEGAAGPVKVLSGRFGPYVTDGEINATLPKTLDPQDVTPEKAAELLAAKREAGPAPKRGRFKKAAPKAKPRAKPKK